MFTESFDVLVAAGREVWEVGLVDRIPFGLQLLEDFLHMDGVSEQKGNFTGAVNGHKEILAAFFDLHFGKITVQIADWVVARFLFRKALPVFVQGQAANAVARKTAV